MENISFLDEVSLDSVSVDSEKRKMENISFLDEVSLDSMSVDSEKRNQLYLETFNSYDEEAFNRSFIQLDENSGDHIYLASVLASASASALASASEEPSRITSCGRRSRITTRSVPLKINKPLRIILTYRVGKMQKCSLQYGRVN